MKIFKNGEAIYNQTVFNLSYYTVDLNFVKARSLVQKIIKCEIDFVLSQGKKIAWCMILWELTIWQRGCLKAENIEYK